MKIGKILIAGLAVSVFSAIFAGATCGYLFSWVYKLEPTNIWKPMQAAPGIKFHLVELILNIILAMVYALFYKGLAGKNKFTKGIVFGLCVWAVGMLPGIFSTYSFMTVATGVIIYWTLLGLIEAPIKGIIISVIYGE